MNLLEIHKKYPRANSCQESHTIWHEFVLSRMDLLRKSFEIFGIMEDLEGPKKLEE